MGTKDVCICMMPGIKFRALSTCQANAIPLSPVLSPASKPEGRKETQVWKLPLVRRWPFTRCFQGLFFRHICLWGSCFTLGSAAVPGSTGMALPSLRAFWNTLGRRYRLPLPHSPTPRLSVFYLSPVICKHFTCVLDAC